MKRLLAYSSIENIGLIVAGIGLAMLFAAYGMKPLAALALTAALYHSLNHAFFKSLLFLGTGSVLHATGERSLGKLGGLIRRMPWVAWLALVGTLASAGLPPLERLRLRVAAAAGFLFTPGLPQLVPQHAGAGRRGGAGRSLVGAVRLRDGEVLRRDLPRPAARGRTSRTRTTPARCERAGMRLARGRLRRCSACCRSQFIAADRPGQRAAASAPASAAAAARRAGWLLAPIDAERASYSPLIFLLGDRRRVVLA